ncbi:MAG: lipopolysaccharide biosynthesis protein [Paludibacteraceae bacterium]|nr:lipopolysaccharide biosynthesis protein [Paludibacteraceae bacterium]
MQTIFYTDLLLGTIARQSVRGTIWTYLGVGVGVVTTFFVLTRFLTAEEIGLARVLIDAATLFIGLAQLGTSTSIVRFFPYFNEKGKQAVDSSPSDRETSADQYHGFFFWTVVIPLVGFCVFALVYWLCRIPISNYFQEKSPLFVNYFYFVLPLAFFMLYQLVFETSSNVLLRTVFPHSVVREFLVRVLLLVLYLLYAKRVLSLDGFVIGLCCVYAVAALCNIVYVFATEHISLRPDFSFPTRELVVNYLRYTGFLILSAAVTVFAPLLSSFMVSAQMGLEYNGIYTIALNIAVLVSIPARSMGAVAQPQLATAIKNDDMPAASVLIRQVSGSLLLVGSFLFLAIWINIDLIFYVLPNGSTYSLAKNAVFFLCLTQLLMTAFSILLPAINYSRYYYISLIFSLLLTVSLVLLNNLLIPRFGVDGAAMAMVTGQSLYFAGLLVFLLLVARINPVGLKHLGIFALLAVVLLANYVWTKYLSGMICNIWVDSILRSVVLLCPALWVGYRAGLSPEINFQIDKHIFKKH